MVGPKPSRLDSSRSRLASFYATNCSKRGNSRLPRVTLGIVSLRWRLMKQRRLPTPSPTSRSFLRPSIPATINSQRPMVLGPY